MKETMENLATAFAGESQANRKYTAFGRQAEKDGFPKVAKLFRTIAEAETIHALGHLAAMGGIKSTAENLKEAMGGETYEFTEMYPPMVEQAEKDGHAAKRMFGYAIKAEAIHAQIYKLALEAVEKGQDISVEDIYLCPVCGHIELKKPSGKCAICGVPAEKFVTIN